MSVVLEDKCFYCVGGDSSKFVNRVRYKVILFTLKLVDLQA